MVRNSFWNRPSGGYAGDGVMVCGFENYEDYPARCFIYESGLWTNSIVKETEQRRQAAYHSYPKRNALIMVGGQSLDRDSLSISVHFSGPTGEIYTTTVYRDSGPDITNIFDACTVRLTDESFLVIGGLWRGFNRTILHNEQATLELHLKDKTSPKYHLEVTYTESTSMNARRKLHACGRISNTILAIGGVYDTYKQEDKYIYRRFPHNSTEMRTMTDDNWRMQPQFQLPYDLHRAAYVATEENGLYLLGGDSTEITDEASISHKTILWLPCVEAANAATCKWIVLKQQLKTPRKHQIAIALKKSSNYCGGRGRMFNGAPSAKLTFVMLTPLLTITHYRSSH